MAGKWDYFINLRSSSNGRLVGITLMPDGPTGELVDFPHSEGVRPLLSFLRARWPGDEFKSVKDGFGGWDIMSRPKPRYFHPASGVMF
jgi:hypothetical protein